MRRRQLKWLWRRLNELAAMKITREQLLMKLGAARAKAPIGWRLIDIKLDQASASFAFALNRTRLRQIRRREGRYLLRTNLTEGDPANSLAILHPARRRRRSLQKPEGRSRHPTDLPSRGTPDRGPYLHRLSGLLFVHHAAAPPACAGAGAERPQRYREVRRGPNDRRPSPDHRRPRTRADPIHPAGTRAATPDQPAQVPIAASATTQDHCNRPSQPTLAVVKTFPANPLISSRWATQNGSNPRSRANAVMPAATSGDTIVLIAPSMDGAVPIGRHSRSDARPGMATADTRSAVRVSPLPQETRVSTHSRG